MGGISSSTKILPTHQYLNMSKFCVCMKTLPPKPNQKRPKQKKTLRSACDKNLGILASSLAPLFPRNLQRTDPRSTEPEKTWVSHSSIATYLGIVIDGFLMACYKTDLIHKNPSSKWATTSNEQPIGGLHQRPYPRYIRGFNGPRFHWRMVFSIGNHKLQRLTTIIINFNEK